MRLNRIFLFGICICLYWGCEQNDKAYYVPEPEDYLSITDTIGFTPHHIKTPSLLPVRMIVVNNHLVIAQAKDKYSFCIQELPLGGDSFLGVLRGRGPAELIEPDFKSLAPDGEGFIIADVDNLMKRYIIRDSEVVMEDKQRFFDTNVLNGVIKVGSTLLNVNIDERESHPYEFVALKADGSKEYIGEIPDWDIDTSQEGEISFITYANMHIARPHGDRIAEFYSFFRKVRILDEKGRILSETSINYPTPSSRVPPSEGIYCTYGIPPCASDLRIVALAENSFRAGGPVNPQGNNYSEFQIWDWNGHLLHRVIIKKKIDVFTVDFSSGTLYGMDQSLEDVVFTSAISGFLDS